MWCPDEQAEEVVRVGLEEASNRRKESFQQTSQGVDDRVADRFAGEVTGGSSL
jgi:hypothetical protein